MMVAKEKERQGRYGTSLRSSSCIILPSLNLYNTNRCKLGVHLALYAKLYSFAHCYWFTAAHVILVTSVG